MGGVEARIDRVQEHYDARVDRIREAARREIAKLRADEKDKIGQLRRGAVQLSEEGAAFIASWEGFRADAYRDVAGVWTIGYGHTGPDVIPGRSVTRSEALKLLRDDAAIAEAAVRRLVRVRLEQHQLDALVSFTFNVGCGALRSSTLLTLLNRRDYSGARAQFARWNKGGGQVLAGLSRRRAAEAAVFGTHADPPDPLAILSKGERRIVEAHRRALKRGKRWEIALWRGRLTARMKVLRVEYRVLHLREKAPNDRFARYVILREERD
jgi:lysozyme